MKTGNLLFLAAVAVSMMAQQAGRNPPQTASRGWQADASRRLPELDSSGNQSGLQYSSGTGSSRPPSFENVYVNRSVAEYAKTGKWPEGTMFFLEVRAAVTKGSFAVAASIRRHCGDGTRGEGFETFPDGWAWFDLPKGAGTATQLEKQAGCFACHTANGAVEKTFAQFYPARWISRTRKAP